MFYSSISSSLSAASANTWEDLLKPLMRDTSDTKATKINKLFGNCIVYIITQCTII